MNDIFIVPLTNSARICLIDAEDVIKINQYRWSMYNDGYIETADAKLRSVRHNRLHRFITDCPNDNFYEPDHINNFTFDNRKSNLRILNIMEHRHLEGSIL